MIYHCWLSPNSLDLSKAPIEIPLDVPKSPSQSSAQSAAIKYNNEGLEAAKNNKWEEAISFFTLAIDSDEKNHIFYYNRSLAYQKNGQFQESMMDAEKAVYNRSSSLEGYFRVGGISTVCDVRYAVRNYEYCQKMALMEETKIEDTKEFCESLKTQFVKKMIYFNYVFDCRLQNDPRMEEYWKEPEFVEFIIKFCDICHCDCNFPVFNSQIQLSTIFEVLFDPNLQPVLDDLNEIAGLLYLSSSAYFKLKDYRKCIKLSEKLIEIAKVIGADYRLIQKTYKNISVAYMKMNDSEHSKLYEVVSMNDFRIPENREIDITTFLIDIIKIINPDVDEQTLIEDFDQESSFESEKEGNPSGNSEGSDEVQADIIEPCIYTMSTLENDLINLEREKLERTIEFFTEAIDNEPENYVFYYIRSLAFTKAKNLHKVLVDIHKIIALKPDWKEAYYQKARIVINLYKKSRHSVMSYYEEHIKHVTNEMRMKYKLDEIEFGNGDIKMNIDLRTAFQRLLSLEDMPGVVLCENAIAHIYQKDVTDGLNLVLAYTFLGEVCSRLKYYKPAKIYHTKGAAVYNRLQK